MADEDGTQEESMALAVQHPSLTLAQLADDLDVPEGYRVEIIGGQIIVSATPFGRHARIVSHLFKVLWPGCPDGLAPFDMVTVALPGTEERYIPDFVVLPDEVVTDDEWIFPDSEMALAVEITSPGNPENDRVRKLRGYAAAGVPLYLLIDVLDDTATLFEDPDRGVYRRQSKVELGQKLNLPEPFSFSLDTTAFAAKKRP